MIRLILVEDYSIIRAGLHMLINKYDDITIVAEASDGEHAVSLTMEHQPDIVLMDIGLPKINGLEASSRITSQCAEVNVLLLSNHANEEYVLQAIKSGAKGYIKKDSHVSEVRRAIDTVLNGQFYLAPNVSSHIVNYLTQAKNTEPVSGQTQNREPDKAALTSRQTEILLCIAEGLSTKEIAEKMVISVKTVEAHRTNIMNRLGIYHVAGLTRYAIEQGLIET
jgi:DNA-binding NarL/FixJ family response regulator